jgi:hypothetical protein
MNTEPMLAKAAEALPDGEGWLFEPKWDASAASSCAAGTPGS